MSGSLDLPFSVSRHLRLLLSTDRGNNVMRAVLTAVRPGDRVLDAGTGTGLLALLALRAGAAEVIGIDREHLDLARALAEENGAADRIRFVSAELSTTNLPDLGSPSGFDLLLAFIYTNHPLTDEGRSRMIMAVRDEYCTDARRIVPGGVRYRATGCERHDWDLATELADLEAIQDILRSCYGLTFESLVAKAKDEMALARTRPFNPLDAEWRPQSTMSTLRFARNEVRLLTEPAAFAEVDYASTTWAGLPPEVVLTANSPGRMAGVVWTQDLLSDGLVLWSTESYSPLIEPIMVGAGDKIVLDTGEGWRATNIVGIKYAPELTSPRVVAGAR